MFMTKFNFSKIEKKWINWICYFLLILNNTTYAGNNKIFIRNCYDGDTCKSLLGEKIRLACIDTPEIKGKNSEPKKALLVRNYLNKLIKNQEVSIKRIKFNRYERTVAKLYKDKLNIQKHLVDVGLAKIYKKYSFQCEWTKDFVK